MYFTGTFVKAHSRICKSRCPGLTTAIRTANALFPNKRSSRHSRIRCDMFFASQHSFAHHRRKSALYDDHISFLSFRRVRSFGSIRYPTRQRDFVPRPAILRHSGSSVEANSSIPPIMTGICWLGRRDRYDRCRCRNQISDDQFDEYLDVHLHVCHVAPVNHSTPAVRTFVASKERKSKDICIDGIQ